VLPVYPAIALAVGVQLAEFWNQPYPKYPRVAIAFLTLLALASWVGSFYYSPWSPAQDWEVQIILAAVALTMTIASLLAARGDRQFIVILVWGMYVSLLLLMTSSHWVWELAEAYPVKPVAALIQSGTPTGRKVYTSDANGRPSLNFYSDRWIIPAATSDLQKYWQQHSQPYLLLERATLENLHLESVQQLGKAEGWTLITKRMKAEG
jgi:4-amino-4-deoxy-L-arabinose transferase-like glycosyltransferase